MNKLLLGTLRSLHLIGGFIVGFNAPLTPEMFNIWDYLLVLLGCGLLGVSIYYNGVYDEDYHNYKNRFK